MSGAIPGAPSAAWRSENGIEWIEAKLAGGRAAFTTRLGGVSQAPFDTLNLGLHTGDEREAVRENRRRLANALGISPERTVVARQVHGADFVRHTGAPSPSPFAEPGAALPEADAHGTAERGLALAVLVADCLPVALSGPKGIAMLHCGWRGLAAGIVERGVRETGAETAVIGPGIGPAHYEVGVDVLDRFESLGNGIAEGRRLDLGEVARRLLAEAGVAKVETVELCTYSHPDRFFSARRDGERSGRQAGIAWLEA